MLINYVKISNNLKAVLILKILKTVQALLQGTINWINDGKKAQVNADNYQKTIDEYPQITQELRAKLLEESHSSSTIPEKITIPELEQKSFK